MNKNMKNKLMPVLLTFILVMSALAIVPQSLIADPFVFPDGINEKSTVGLACGEEVTYDIRNDSLNESRDYVLWITNNATDARDGNVSGSTVLVELEDGTPTRHGDLSITFNVPSQGNLGVSPLGPWTLILQDEETGNMFGPDWDHQIIIGNLYTVKIKYQDGFIEHLVYNTTYTPIYLYVYNWTGSKLELLDDVDFDIGIYQPDGTEILSNYDTITTGIWDLDIVSDDLDFHSGAGNLEYYLPVYVDDGTQNDTHAIPVLLDVTADYPENAEWGDILDVTGYVKDGQDNGIGGYNVALYAPVNGTYVQTASTTTYSTGRYSLSVETGYDLYTSNSWSAGTWYIGTWYSGDPLERVNETVKFDHTIDSTIGFLRYYWFDVASDETAEIDIESPDELFDGFEQEINVSVQWNGEAIDNYANDTDSADGPAAVHITGIEAYDPATGIEIDEDDFYFVGYTTINYDEESYCIFDIIFNETGTGTIVVTWPYSENVYLFDHYNNTDYAPNITGMLDFQVGVSADMNMVVSDMPDEVMITDEVGGTPTAGDCWVNDSTDVIVTIEVYGDEQSEEMNATIHVSGCGLDFSIDEEDEPADSEYYYDKPSAGVYEIIISPKTGGVITITATNSSEDKSVSKDFSVMGLAGSVTTSTNDDLEISVQSSETITATISNGQYATVKVGYWDEDWALGSGFDCELFEIIGDGETAGEGLNGIFEFEIEDEDIEEGVGYLVVVANAANRWMYEIIEVAPVHDLEIEVIEPFNWTTSDMFTVGFEHEDLELKIYGPDGDVMNDIDEVTALLVDEDNDEDNPLQTINFKERSGNIWVPDDELLPWFPGQLIISAVNNSGDNEHDGNITFDVDYATISYNPGGVTAGIELEDFTVEMTAADANGDPLPEGTSIYLHIENDTGGCVLVDSSISLDEDGIGEFEIQEVGDLKTWINVTLGNNVWSDGNLTDGNFSIDWPMFDVEPDTIFIGKSNTIKITAMDYLGEPVIGINLTLWTGGTSFGVPDPVKTDDDGKVTFSLEPEASGKANVTIVRGIEYVSGKLQWNLNDSIVTNTYITITSIQEMKISVSKSPIFEGETLTVTATSGGNPLSNVDVEFGETTVRTDDTGEAKFTVPDPGVESAVYTITAEKTGYVSVEKSITVIKVYSVKIVGPTKNPGSGEEFTISVLAKGAALAGATIEFDGKTYTSGADGKLTLVAPNTAGSYTISGSYEGYESVSVTITIDEGGIPGFELLTLVAAIGVALILLRRRR
jgi:hypothetical protein